MLAYSVPFIPTAIFWWITGVSGRYMISGFLGSASNGIYSVSSKLPSMLTMLSTVFMDAWQLSAGTESSGDKNEHRRFYSHIWSLFQAGVIICAALMIALAFGIAAGLAVSPHILKRLMERDMGAVMYMVIGMMVGSLYAIVVGSTTLKVPQPAMTFADFSIVWFIIGAAAVLTPCVCALTLSLATR